MQDVTQALASYLKDMDLGVPLVWENWAMAADLPRIEVRVRGRSTQTLSYSGLSLLVTQFSLRVLVAEGQGQSSALPLIDQLLNALKPGTKLAGGQISQAPAVSGGQARAGLFMRELTLSLNTHQ